MADGEDDAFFQRVGLSTQQLGTELDPKCVLYYDVFSRFMKSSARKQTVWGWHLTGTSIHPAVGLACLALGHNYALFGNKQVGDGQLESADDLLAKVTGADYTGFDANNYVKRHNDLLRLHMAVKCTLVCEEMSYTAPSSQADITLGDAKVLLHTQTHTPYRTQ